MFGFKKKVKRKVKRIWIVRDKVLYNNIYGYFVNENDAYYFRSDIFIENYSELDIDGCDIIKFKSRLDLEIVPSSIITYKNNPLD